MLHCFHEDSDGFPWELFQKGSLPNLEKLQVACCNFKEIFDSQTHDVMNLDDNDVLFPDLKGLELTSLGHLESIGLEQSSVAPILENLETLKVQYCHRLRNLVASTAESFTKLRELRVHDCQGLLYLVTLSTARSLVLLEVLSIERCGSIQEIVSEEVDGSDQHDITFRKLKTLNLVSLQRLGCFHSGNSTFNLPCLESVFVYECPKMRIFAYGAIKSTEHTRVSTGAIKYGTYPQPIDGFVVHQWSHKFTGLDLNESIELLFPSQVAQFISGMQGLKLGEYFELQDIWHGVITVPDGGFGKLRSLIVDSCQFLSHFVIPFHLLGFLINLEELQVRNCGSVKAIFEVISLSSPFLINFKNLQVKNCDSVKAIFDVVGPMSTSFSFPLKKMTLKKLPKLKCICSGLNNEEWPKLENLEVSACDGLVYLFTSSTAKSLALLEYLSVCRCDSLQEIVAKGDEESDEEEEITFGNLKTLDLYYLPTLDSFSKGTYHLKFPCLKQVDIYDCSQMKVLSHADIYAPDNVNIESYDDDLIDMLEKAFHKKAT